ncbi:MAG: hypothetical protein ACJAUC_003131 [Planctomycetota bacterium]|jgi:hypothetical protein
MTSADALLDRPSPQRVACDLLLAIAFGWFAYTMSCWLVPPVAHAIGFGTEWQLMSENPFRNRGLFPHRALVPFVAWLFGLGGESYVGFTHGLHALMLMSVFFVVKRLRGLYLDALLVTFAVAITAPVQMYKLHWSGYTDPICYTLFLWMMVAVRKPVVMWSLLLVNLTNHEMAVFLVPWLWFLRRREDSRWQLDGICLGAVLAIYAGFYFWVKASVAETYSVDYFMANPLFPGGSFVVWNLAAVHYTCAFGPLLAVLAWHQHTKNQTGERWHLWLVALGIFVIFCIAFDWARHSNLILLPLIIAATRFLAVSNRHRAIFIGLLLLTQVLFWIWPPWAPVAWPTNELVEGDAAWRAAHPAPQRMLVTTGIVVPTKAGIGFGPLSAVLDNWLPLVWKLLLTIHAIGITIWCAGWAWARHQNRATS